MNRRREQLLAQTLCTALVVCAPLLLGGATRWTAAAIVMLCGMSALVLVRGTRLPIHEADLALAGLVVWTLLQLIPLPPFFAQAAVLDSREFVGADGWAPLSLEPGATWGSAAIWCGALCAFGVGRMSASRVGTRGVLAAVAASAVLLAVVAFGHEVLSARRVFAVYEPVETTPTLLSPLLNANHLGGFLAFGAACCLALALSAREKRGAAMACTGAVLCGLGALGTASRGAVLSLVCGVVLTFVLVVRRRSRRRDWVILVASSVVVGAVFLVTGWARFSQDVAEGDYSKLELISRAFSLSLERPLIGVGRGAFESAFGAGDTHIRFTHAENLVAQWASEWGWVVSLLALGVFARLSLRAWRSPRMHVAVAGAAVWALFVHELFDFALELPGVLAVVMVLLGALATERSSSPSRVSSRFRALYAVAGVLALLLAAIGATSSAQASAARIREAEAGEVRAVTRSALLRHPLRPDVALAAARRLAADQDGYAMGWFNLAMRQAPSWSSPHTGAAHLLASRGALPQALLEMAHAERLNRGESDALICYLVTRVPLEEVARVVASPSAGSLSLSDKASECWSENGERRSALDELLLQRAPDVGAELLYQVLGRQGLRAFRAGELERARIAYEQIPEVDRVFSVHLRYAEVLARVENPDTALAYLEELAVGEENEAAYTSTMARLHGASGDRVALDEALSRLRRLAAGRASDLARAWETAARIYGGPIGDLGASMAAYQRAVRLDPSEASYRWGLARVARRAGLRDVEGGALRELCARGHERACVDD